MNTTTTSDMTPPTTSRYNQFARGAIIAGKRAERWVGDERSLTHPLHWRSCRHIAVSSDLFHEDVPDEFIRQVFAVMSMAGQHVFQVLTKRPERMAAWFADPENSLSACQAEFVVRNDTPMTPSGRWSRIRNTSAINGHRKGVGDGNYWPLPNVWLGTSVENQKAADERIPLLLKCPAAVRFLSCEPLLEAVDLTPWIGSLVDAPEETAIPPDPIHWVITGGESGSKARPCNVPWIRSIVTQCKGAGVPVFVKQLGAAPITDGPLPMLARHADGGRARRWPCLDRKGGDPAEWPENLRLREWPVPGGTQ